MYVLRSTVSAGNAPASADRLMISAYYLPVKYQLVHIKTGTNIPGSADCRTQRLMRWTRRVPRDDKPQRVELHAGTALSSLQGTPTTHGTRAQIIPDAKPYHGCTQARTCAPCPGNLQRSSGQSDQSDITPLDEPQKIAVRCGLLSNASRLCTAYERC